MSSIINGAVPWEKEYMFNSFYISIFLLIYLSYMFCMYSRRGATYVIYIHRRRHLRARHIGYDYEIILRL